MVLARYTSLQVIIKNILTLEEGVIVYTGNQQTHGQRRGQTLITPEAVLPAGVSGLGLGVAGGCCAL